MQRWMGLVTAILIGACATVLHSESAHAADDAPPLVAGRVSHVEGEVQIWRAEEDGDGQWDPAQVNDVVTAGTALTTANGRAEMRVGPHAFRLDASSSGGFSQLDIDRAAFALERGVINLRLAPAQQSEDFALEVAGVRVDLALPGRYRVDAIEGSPLRVTAFEGQAAVRYGGNSVTVSTGQALVMTQSSINFAAAESTPLDDWAWARDDRYAQVQAARYVSPSMTGYEELDAYGDWIPDASYGTVWAPRAVPVGWAPYRHGRWRWVSPWGWTWVDAAPWGYAPFHYGRWVVIGSRWCWWPGGYVARPVWAPALVGFVGTTGSAVPFGAGGPVVGWYPLAPWHQYRPHYRADTRYVTIINQTIINRPPRGVPPDVNQHPGSTWVPGQRFREPIVKVRIPAQTEKVADLRPIAPPPRPVRTTGPRSDVAQSAPPPRVAPPAVRGAKSVAQTVPNLSLTQPQPLPGADTTLTQPAPIRRVEPRPQPAPAPRPEVDAPRPKPHFPQETVPPYQQLQKPFGAEPARTPPAAPPTVRQPNPVAAPSAPQPVAAPPPAVRAPTQPPVARNSPGAAPPQRTVAAPATPAPQAAQPPPQHAAPPQHATPPQQAAPPQAAPQQQAAPPQQAAPAQRAAPVPQPGQTSKQDALQEGNDTGRGKPGPDVPRSKTMAR
jgi:hypothetical protein